MSADRPVVGEDWDGTGVRAQIKTPEHLYQAINSDVIYFVDDKSCARMVDTATGYVTTELGKKNLAYIPLMCNHFGTQLAQ